MIRDGLRLLVLAFAVVGVGGEVDAARVGGGGGGEHRRGLELYRAGRYADAVEAFRAAQQARPGDAEVAYNLALALWRAGADVEAAEVEAEKAATLSDGALAPLRDGLLGNLRFDAARALAADAGDPQAPPDLGGALTAANEARDYFLRAITGSRAPRPELGRNLERANRLIDELEKRIEEQDEQPSDDSSSGEDGEPGEESEDGESGEQNQDGKPSDQPQDPQEQEPGENENEPESGENPNESESSESGEQQQPPEPDPNESPAEEPPAPEPDANEPPAEPSPPAPESEQSTPEEGASENDPQPQAGPDDASPPPEPEPAGAPPPAPGEQAPERLLSPEEAKRIQDMLQRFEEARQKFRARGKARRPKVEKDW